MEEVSGAQTFTDRRESFLLRNRLSRKAFKRQLSDLQIMRRVCWVLTSVIYLSAGVKCAIRCPASSSSLWRHESRSRSSKSISSISSDSTRQTWSLNRKQFCWKAFGQHSGADGGDAASMLNLQPEIIRCLTPSAGRRPSSLLLTTRSRKESQHGSVEVASVCQHFGFRNKEYKRIKSLWMHQTRRKVRGRYKNEVHSVLVLELWIKLLNQLYI